jgi:hypothetical protein
MRTRLGLIFPANRENNREFCRFGQSAAILASNPRANSIACSEIPYASEQGNFGGATGNFCQHQGIFIGRAANSCLHPTFESQDSPQIKSAARLQVRRRLLSFC